jgi:DNA end-binding protein Ku
MDALRQSITSYASKPKKPRKAAAGQKEMLLPIDGKGGSEKKATKSESILGNVRRPRLRVAYRS